MSNGKELLVGVDGRSATMRRYRDLHTKLTDEASGPTSEARRIAIGRAAALSVWCEQPEAGMANGGDIDIGRYTTAANTLRRLLADLGLRPARKPQPAG